MSETSGKSGATIREVFVRIPNGGGDQTGPECWGPPLRVPPGGTLDMVDTDEGAAWLLYCAPGTGGTYTNPQLHVFVTFTDDDGGVGTATALATGS